MGLELSDPEIDALIRQLSDITGEPVVEVVRISLRERSERLRPVRSDWDQAAIDAIVARCAALPALDGRSAEDILGYDENGLPT